MLPEFAFRVAAEMRLGKHLLQLIYAGPAHSMSDVMMLVLPERVLFAGDIVQMAGYRSWPRQRSTPATGLRHWMKWAAWNRVSLSGPWPRAHQHREAIDFTQTYIRFVRAKMAEAVENWVSFDHAYKSTDWGTYAKMPGSPRTIEAMRIAYFSKSN